MIGGFSMYFLVTAAEQLFLERCSSLIHPLLSLQLLLQAPQKTLPCGNPPTHLLLSQRS